MSRNYIGIDVGTSIIKGQLISEKGVVLGSASFPSPAYSKEGLDCVSAEESYSLVEKILEGLFQKAHGEVDAICFSSFGEAFALVDEEGKTKTDFILFVSSLGDEETNHILGKMPGDEIAKISGEYPHRMYSFSKLMYLKKTHPEYFAKGTKMLLVAQYMVYRLSGVYAADYSLASRTMLFDVRNRVWSKELLDLCGIPASLMPELRETDQIVGELSMEAAQRLGAKRTCHILASGHDQLLAAVGSGLEEAGMANDGIGTAECLTVAFPHFPDDPGFYRHGYCVVPYVIDGLYLTYALVATGGSLLKWHRDFLNKKEAQEWKEQGKDYYVSMNENPVKLPTSLFVLPHFGAAGTPNLNLGGEGAIIGLNTKTSKEEIYFALMEGCSYEIRLNMDLLEEAGVHVARLSATGGGANSPEWLSIKSNIYHRSIEGFENSEGGILGCFLMAKHAVEGIPYSDLFAQFVKRKQVASPSPEIQKEYEERYQKYRKIYSAMEKIG
ncbi:MAG: hypothetical protein J5736_05330 [Bacilli bacterium]|nr:hypothetical protein [Bacilli bacterium]